MTTSLAKLTAKHYPIDTLGAKEPPLGIFSETIDWYRKRRVIISDDLKNLESGETKMMAGHDFHDDTARWIERYKNEIAELDRLIASYEKLDAPRP
jgi:hypothetical protein